MKIIVGTFKEEAQGLADFLGPRLGDVPVVSGGEITFDDDKMKKTIRSRHVKTYIKRYLNKKGERENYQILVEGRELRMIELEKEEEEEKEDKKRGEKAKKEEKEGEETPKLPAPEGQAEQAPSEPEAKETGDEDGPSESTSS